MVDVASRPVTFILKAQSTDNGGPGVDSRGFEGLAEALSTSFSVILEDCGHYGWLDQPEADLSAVQDFLAAVEGR